MSIYGYCRVSTPQQSIERQIRNIKTAYPASIIVQEKYTGTSLARPKWQSLMKRLTSGDSIVFDSVSRMSRNAEEGFQCYQELYKKGISLIFLKEPMIDTATYRTALQNGVQLTGTAVDLILDGVNAYLMELAREQIRLAFEQSEKEVQDLHQRTKEGIETARLAGKQIGLKKGSKLHVPGKAETLEKILTHSKSFGGTLSDSDCMKVAGVCRNTYYKYKKEIRETMSL